MDTPDGAPIHAHRWQIEKQDGPSSVGVCACGETKTFSNGWDRVLSDSSRTRKTAPRVPRK